MSDVLQVVAFSTAQRQQLADFLAVGMHVIVKRPTTKHRHSDIAVLLILCLQSQDRYINSIKHNVRIYKNFLFTTIYHKANNHDS